MTKCRGIIAEAFNPTSEEFTDLLDQASAAPHFHIDLDVNDHAVKVTVRSTGPSWMTGHERAAAARREKGNNQRERVRKLYVGIRRAGRSDEAEIKLLIRERTGLSRRQVNRHVSSLKGLKLI
jgi:hypothetical protein